MCGRDRDVPVLTSLSTCTQIKQKVSVFLLVNNSVGLFTVYKQMTEDKKEKKKKTAITGINTFTNIPTVSLQAASTCYYCPSDWIHTQTVELVMTRADNGVL